MRSRVAISALVHIRFNIVLVGDFIRGMDYMAFESDLKTYATTRALRAVGNVFRHGYEEVTISTIWATVAHRLAPLLAVVEEELSAPDCDKDQESE